jgi:hypothetical protein
MIIEVKNLVRAQIGKKKLEELKTAEKQHQINRNKIIFEQNQAELGATCMFMAPLKLNITPKSRYSLLASSSITRPDLSVAKIIQNI